jgi:nitroimidazol reductase NimA-like FMN-containing flavoprotein (pyridoxamine 5'-phosphate oxidase superfamily)
MRRKEREVTEMSEIETIISGSDVCRIAFANGNVPYIVTMNFGYSGGRKPCLYFHCAPEGRKLEMMNRNNFVCFEMDADHVLYRGEKGCDWGMNFSSVVGYGKIYIVENIEERRSGLDCIMKQYGGSGVWHYDEKILGRTTILRLEISEISGKRK